ncbi:hypothetical protein HDU67_007427 [Dinochytrium kinnereticum]|nr:hypothetical protein HDU67_007427 [Dinochytrium kinnereticum]
MHHVQSGDEANTDRLIGILNTQDRPLLMDGAIGTMLREYLESAKDPDLSSGNQPVSPSSSLLQTNLDAISLEHPEWVIDLHRNYLDAGANILTTNTFTANAIDQEKFAPKDVSLDDWVHQLNRVSVKLARRACTQYHNNHPKQSTFVAGSIGPTALMFDAGLTHANEVRDKINSSFNAQATILLESGADLIIMETIYHIPTFRIALSAVLDAFQGHFARCLEGSTGLAAQAQTTPLAISFAVNKQGLMPCLPHEDPADIISEIIAMVRAVLINVPLIIGLNCGFGPESLNQPMRRISEKLRDFCMGSEESNVFIMCSPSAGMPDQTGAYEGTPDAFAEAVTEVLHACDALHAVRVVGGCCGSRPAHIRSLSRLLQQSRSRASK